MTAGAAVAAQAPATAPALTGPAAAPRAAGLPLTAAQRAAWHSAASGACGTGHSTAESVEIHGPLDAALFVEALHRVAGEAEALRVRFTRTPQGPRQIPLAIGPVPHPVPVHSAEQAPPGRWPTGEAEVPFPVRVLDLRTEPAPDAAARSWTRADLDTPLDAASGPLFAQALLRVGEHRWLWYQRVHHAVMDDYGRALLVRRTAEVYTALAAGSAPGPSPFGRLADFVACDTAYRASGAFDRDGAHWHTAMAGVADAPSLAAAPAPPCAHTLRRTGHISPRSTDRLGELALSIRATWPHVLIAAQALYVARATASREVVLGLPMAGRTGPAALRTPGLAANVLPLRLTVAPESTFAELTRQVVLGIRAARRHQRYRPEDIRGDLGLAARGGTLIGPLVKVVPAGHGPTFAGARSTVHHLASGPVEDLTVTVTITDPGRGGGAGPRVDHDANPDRYTAAELEAHQARFLDLLTRIAAADPHAPLARHGILTPDEHTLVLDEFNPPARAVPPTTFIGPVEAQACRTPTAVALRDGELSLTYAELNARANRLARHLVTRGVRPGALAAVALPHGVERVVAVLAVLKAGGALLPLDPAAPHGRSAHALSDAAPVCLVTTAATHAQLPAFDCPLVLMDGLDPSSYPSVNPGRPLTPQHPVCVSYAPGACPPAEADGPVGVIVAHSALDHRVRRAQQECGARPGAHHAYRYDGGAPAEEDLVRLCLPLRTGGVLVLDEAPAISAETARHTRRYVLDGCLAPCPPGVGGDLYLAGPEVATGYLGHPARTATRFVPDPYGPPGSRMYRADARARWTHDGELEELTALRAP